MTNIFMEPLTQLAKLRGLGEAYYDHRGQLHFFSLEAKRAILQAMRLPVDDAVALQNALIQESQRAIAPLQWSDNHQQCYEPPVLTDKKCWGLSVQLYTLRSTNNWGIGDFSDLRQLIGLAAPLGCDVIGLNPLHALMPADPQHISPYSPSSRLFLNALYIAVTDIPEFSESEAARRWFKQLDIQTEIAALRATNVVQYLRVARLKFQALRILHTYFFEQHIRCGTSRAAAFERYLQEAGEALKLHATYDALDAHFRQQATPLYGWSQWPVEYQDPRSPDVQTFATQNANDINYYQYLQWLATDQLSSAQQYARDQGMQIGLYGDLAVGANRSGSEVWSNQQLYVTDAAIGAPPDPLALNGQDWGIPPIDPNQLQFQKFQPFIQLLRANMCNVNALRIDHVMSLFRLWWVPRSFSAADGVYVHYPLAALTTLLQQESQHSKCLVIGEDLGTVPDEIRDAMAKYRLYHYTVLLFEKRDDGNFKSGQEYPRQAVATATTHDLPPLKSWWQADDIDLREQLGVYPGAEVAGHLREEREHDRRLLLRAMDAENLWHWQDGDALPLFSAALARAIHLFLGVSNAALTLVQLEDLIGMTTPINVPGTHTEYPNWQRKLEVATHDIFKRSEVRESLTALTKARAGLNPNA